MPNDSLHSRLSLGHVAFLAGVLCMAIACILLKGYADNFAQKQAMTTTIGIELPALRSQVAMLAASVEAQRLYGADANASREEQAQVYILPTAFDTARAVRTLQEVALSFRDEIAVTSITFAKDPVDRGTLKALPVTVLLRGSAKQVARFLRVLQLSGTFTVRDVLQADIVNTLLERIQEAHPLSLKQAEAFLSIDLIAYALNPDDAESALLTDVNPSVAIDIRTLLLESGLRDVRLILGDIALSLRDKRLWPFPLMKTVSLEQTGDVWTIQMELMRR